MIDADIPGAPSWADLSTPDPDEAARFYEALLGWDIERVQTPMGEHVICRAGDHDVGGMMAADPSAADVPPMWTVFFTVGDVDAAAEDVRHAGGTVLEPPFDIPEARVAVVTDPTGAMFALIANPKLPPEPWLSPRAGAVCWVELLTRDPAAAEGFYAAVFGWKAETTDYGDVRYTSFDKDDTTVAGMMMMPDSVPAEAPSLWSIYFAVDDCDLAERRAVDLGGLSLRPTTQTGEGRFAVLADPAGATFQVMDERTGS